MKFALLACLPLLAGEKEVVALWPLLPAGSAEVWVERSTTPGVLDRAVSNIHNPTLTVYLPEPGKATGAALIIAAGGGHQRLAIDKEGYNVAKYFSDRGVAAFVLKYRLAREKDSKYTVEEHALGDGARAIRMVRANAKKWGVDPEKIGIIGFSAGGEVAALAGTNYDAGDASAADPVARVSSRPSYMVLMYGALRSPKLVVTKDTPPAFLVHADDDALSAEMSANFYVKMKKAGVPCELHIYATGGHGFGMLERPLPVTQWPVRLVEWMKTRQLLP